MNAEEKQKLVRWIEAELLCSEDIGYTGNARKCMVVALDALVALTTQPVISDDTKRMDWLCAHCVEVRYPLMYGSREMFRAQQDSEEWELPHHTTLREQVDAAIANEVQE